MGVSALSIPLHLHIVIISVHACTVFSEFTPCNQTTCVLYHTMASKATRTEYEFVKTPSEKYFCPVTFELLKDPRQTNSCCGHHLSREAAEQLEEEGKPCPLCKKWPLRTAEDLFFKRKVLQLKIRCSNKPQGCQWVGELGDLDRHLKLGSVDGKCQFVEVECPLKCDKYIQRRDLVNHQSNECPKRAFTCKHCGFKSTYEGVTADHWPKCQRCPVICPNKCSKGAIERRFLQRHLKEDCPLQEIECKFSYAGCTAKVEHSEMKEHMDSNKDEHLGQLAEYGKAMKTELETLAFAFSKFVSKPFFVPPPEIVLDNFEKLKNKNKRWYCSPFYTHIGGYKMCLRIDANGCGSGENTHVSVAVHMMKGEFDSHLQWPFKGEITVQLVNQKVGGEHYERKPVQTSYATTEGYNDAFCRCTEGDRSTSGFGLGQFISHADLYKPKEGKEYLKNDTLKFRVTDIVVTSVES